ncbi:Scramblase-domain-containing protein [Infundibulicybe gibba]|nr:Scramblase-domain-containing protein [Infundibulicybe gibba]
MITHPLSRTIWTAISRPSNRSYALSRFPERSTGTGRSRKNILKRSEWMPAPIPHEPRPSTLDSPLWKASQRAPVSSPDHGMRRLLLSNETLVIERQLEMLNVFIGFEQSNKYSISTESGESLGYIAEEPRGFFALMARQAFATHRPFRAVVMDLDGTPIMWGRPPFSWINSRMYAQRLLNNSQYTQDGEPVLDTFGEVQQIWHLWRRRYDLFIREAPGRIVSTVSEAQPEPEPSTFSQFAHVDSGFLAWHFLLHDSRGSEMAYVSRAFRGFGREIFTDTGRYSVCFGPRPDAEVQNIDQTRTLTLDQRAVRHIFFPSVLRLVLSLICSTMPPSPCRQLVLALAINIDFDYFSRHSGPGR